MCYNFAYKGLIAMYKRCVTEQSARRQRELEAGLLAAMMAHQYEDITISDLCDSMKVPRKSFYRYFSSKDGALYALIDHTLSEFSGEFFSQEMTATIGTLERFFCFWRSHADFLDALAKSSLSGILLQRSIMLVLEQDLLSKRLLPFDKKSAQEYAITFLISGLISLVVQWHRSSFKEDPHDLATIAAHLMTKQMITTI